MKTKMAEEASKRSNIYGFLARVYSREITGDFLPLLKDPQFLGVLSVLGGNLDDDLLTKPEYEAIEDLAVEYTSLFLGPGPHVSPHESVHHERPDGDWGRFWGASTVEVKKFIETTGLQYRDDFKDMPDHISVELEFMQKVIEKERDLWESGENERALYCLKMEKKFFDEHLIKWIPIFCEEVISKAELPFYREFAGITRSFIEFENDNMEAYLSNAQKVINEGKRD
jgi:TorA maturation chaperone TorD